VAERRLIGRRASPGFAAGTVAVLAPAAAQRRGTGDAAAEAKTLQAALAAALDEVRALALTVTGDDTDIIGLQIALMEDPALAEPAYAAIAAGESADRAWAAALDAEIAGYENAADEYFRARASDLKDIRDRVLDHVAGSAAASGPAPGAIVAARDLPPSRFLAIDWSQGGAILLTAGSASSHVAMLARSRGIPMVVGLGGDPASLAGEVLVDAVAGEVVVDPAPETRRGFERRRAADAGLAAEAARCAGEPAVTRDGTRVAVQLNVSDPDELMALDPSICDGIGLVRTEFLFHAHRGLPDEETQYRVYRRIAVWAHGKPVTIRTLDAGGDKPIDGLTAAGESNPFLGLRGIRLSLARPEIFRLQLRALARAACHGSIKIMLPMITTPQEVAAARALLDAEVGALAAAGIAARRPPLGIMVEVPATAIAIDLFHAEFYSIGSNDLVQYVTAAGRDIDAVADLADPAHPAVMRLIAGVARHGRDIRREVSLCGDMAGEPAFVPALLRAGLRVISVAPAAFPRAKAAIAAVDLADVAAPALAGSS
jgi:phosphotransferase system enzyme I (PtsI)